MNTAAEASRLLQQALDSSQQAEKTIDDLMTVHDYQDVALLVTQAANNLLEAAKAFMNSKDEPALDFMEAADDLLDEIYKIIDGDLDEEEE